MPDYITHLEQALLLLPLTQQEHLSLSLPASLHHQPNPCESPHSYSSIMANLHIKKDESLKASS